MKIDKKKAITLFASILLITTLLLVNLNVPASAPVSDGTSIYLHGPPLTPIHLNSNKTLTPIHMHHRGGILQLGDPRLEEPNSTTYWTELYPTYDPVTVYHLSSWIDTNKDGLLSPNDQIDMNNTDTGEIKWYHVDRMTVTLLLSGPYPGPTHDPATPTMAIELKWPKYWPEVKYDYNLPPYLNTTWHEVWPNYSNIYNLTSWADDPSNLDGRLSFTDSIDLTDVNGTVTWWHVEDVSTDIILREKIMDPIGTLWHEIYPSYSNWHNLTSWVDNGDGVPGPGDQIDMVNKTSGITNWYHVDRVTVTLNVTLEPDRIEWMKIELKTLYFEEMYEAFKYPNGTLWHEVYPSYSNVYRVVQWDFWEDDNCNGVLDPSDNIYLQNVTSPLLEVGVYHVEDITYDLILNKKITDPTSIIWHELYPTFSNLYQSLNWSDNNDGILSPSDQIGLLNLSDGTDADYHVDNVTLTMRVVSDLWDFYVELNATFEDIYLAKTKPVSTWWYNVYPYFGESYHLSNWTDNCNGVLDVCDYINLTDPSIGWWDIFHVEELSIDIVVTPKAPPPPPPPPPEMYWKANYTDYAPSGMPDFDQTQSNWTKGAFWTWCTPVAVANSLWWMDSRFETSTTPPPTVNSTFPLVPIWQIFAPPPVGPYLIDDHDPGRVQYLVQQLAYLMDTDGQRTGIAHSGTFTWDMQAGIAQYLSWTGVNPEGDVNGDGIVNMTDYNIVLAANGTSPGQAGWDMAADIWPVSHRPDPWVIGTWNPADNVVNQSDLDLVTAHMNETGLFYEKTLYIPDFYEVEAEVERSEDVILVLGFWYYNETTDEWIRADYPDTPYDQIGLGHAVTVAGINSSELKIAISDPGLDAFEAGSTPGRSPVSHPYPHNSTVHNNASLVSHDIYNVTLLAPTAPGKWALQGYVGNPAAGAPPGTIAVVEGAVITSPLEIEVPGVEIVNVTVSHCSQSGIIVDEAYKTWTVDVDVTVHNNGTTTINVTVSVYYFNATFTQQIGASQTITNLPPSNNVTLTFSLDISGLPVGITYTLKANATGTGGASDEFVNGQMTRRRWGDVTGDGFVKLDDVGKLDLIYSLIIKPPYWPLMPDITGDCYVKLDDVGKMDLIYSGILTEGDP